MRDAPVGREARVGARMHARPADDLVVVVREDAGRRVLGDQLADPLASRLTPQRLVLLRRLEVTGKN